MDTKVGTYRRLRRHKRGNMRASHIILLDHDADMADASSLDKLAAWACGRVEEIVTTPEDGWLDFDWVASEALNAVEIVDGKPCDITYADARAEFLADCKFSSSHFVVEPSPEKRISELRRILQVLSCDSVETSLINDLAYRLRACANYAETGLPGVAPVRLFDPFHSRNSDMRERGEKRGPWALIKFEVRF